MENQKIKSVYQSWKTYTAQILILTGIIVLIALFSSCKKSSNTTSRTTSTTQSVSTSTLAINMQGAFDTTTFIKINATKYSFTEWAYKNQMSAVNTNDVVIIQLNDHLNANVAIAYGQSNTTGIVAPTQTILAHATSTYTIIAK
jgi:hypothetical protein